MPIFHRLTISMRKNKSLIVHQYNIRFICRREALRLAFPDRRTIWGCISVSLPSFVVPYTANFRCFQQIHDTTFEFKKQAIELSYFTITWQWIGYSFCQPSSSPVGVLLDTVIFVINSANMACILFLFYIEWFCEGSFSNRGKSFSTLISFKSSNDKYVVVGNLSNPQLRHSKLSEANTLLFVVSRASLRQFGHVTISLCIPISETFLFD